MTNTDPHQLRFPDCFGQVEIIGFLPVPAGQADGPWPACVTVSTWDRTSRQTVLDLTPDEARAMAALLIAQADAAEGK